MELNHKILGSGHPILVIHGLFGMLDNWQTVGRALSDDFMLYLVDVPNHGKSPDIDTFNYPHVAEIMHTFMEANWLYESYVLGHSMGGKIAMQLALQYPDTVEKLVVVDIGTKAYTGGHQHIFDAMRRIDVGKMDNRRDIQEQLEVDLDSQDVVLFLMKNLSRRKEGGYAWKFNLDGLYKDYDSILSGISGTEPYDGPALFIRGDRSNYIQDEDWPEIQALFPEAELVTIQDSGHWVHADQPEALMQTVREFLNR